MNEQEIKTFTDFVNHVVETRLAAMMFSTTCARTQGALRASEWGSVGRHPWSCCAHSVAVLEEEVGSVEVEVGW